MESTDSVTDPLPPGGWRSLSAAVYEVNQADGHADLSGAIVSAMKRLVRADVVTFHALDRESGRSILRMSPATAFTTEEIAHYFAEPEAMPLVAYYARTDEVHARRLSDVIATREFCKSRYYDFCLSRQGLRYALALPLKVDEKTVVGMSYNRAKRDFSVKDRALLDAFGPHVALAWRRHGDPWKEEQAEGQPPLEQWTARGLTARECDVLWWMTEGKQNIEIASILGITLATVQKHVAHIVSKLNAENRHAATVMALRGMLAGR
jgi:DNA-binding CsgD family transcriptional regulator